MPLFGFSFGRQELSTEELEKMLIQHKVQEYEKEIQKYRDRLLSAKTVEDKNKIRDDFLQGLDQLTASTTQKIADAIIDKAEQATNLAEDKAHRMEQLLVDHEKTLSQLAKTNAAYEAAITEEVKAQTLLEVTQASAKARLDKLVNFKVDRAAIKAKLLAEMQKNAATSTTKSTAAPSKVSSKVINTKNFADEPDHNGCVTSQDPSAGETPVVNG